VVEILKALGEFLQGLFYIIDFMNRVIKMINNLEFKGFIDN